jgi:hypothetical protein
MSCSARGRACRPKAPRPPPQGKSRTRALGSTKPAAWRSALGKQPSPRPLLCSASSGRGCVRCSRGRVASDLACPSNSFLLRLLSVHLLILALLTGHWALCRRSA